MLPHSSTVFVLLEHTTDGVDAIGVYPTRGSAEDGRSRLVKKTAAGMAGVRVEQGTTQIVNIATKRALLWYTIHPATGHRLTVHRAVKSPGRGRTTGRFATRDELIDRIEFLYWGPGDMSQTAIGKSCGVSQGVVNSILQGEIAERRRNR